MRAWIALGSNVGDRLANLTAAIHGLNGKGLRVCRVSGVYETQPVEVTDQDPFLNAVVEVETNLTPFSLLSLLQELERAGGRQRTRPKGPRTIDLDLLFYGDWVVGSHRLRLPHPAMHERAFVLIPAMDLNPDQVIPGFGGRTIGDLKDRCKDETSQPKRLSIALVQD